MNDDDEADGDLNIDLQEGEEAEELFPTHQEDHPKDPILYADLHIPPPEEPPPSNKHTK